MKRVITCLLALLFVLQPLCVSATGYETEPTTAVTEQPDEGIEDAVGTGESPEDTTEGGVGSEEDPSDSTEGGTGSEEDTEQPGEGEEVETVPFSCYTADSQGTKLNAYWSEEEYAWYLFVPSTQNLADTAIYYTGTVTETTAGQVDAENAVITGAFAENGDRVILTASDGSVHTVVVMQSKLPSVCITLNGVSLDEVHRDKNIKYKKNTVSILDPGGENNLLVENSVEFKGRGNSTWTFFDKKGYQIKFEDKTSVLGMGKAKKWVLLANAADETLMRNMLAYELASDLGMEFGTDFAYVDLWINGEYRGNYILGEKIEIGSSRVDLTDDNGTIFEQDQGFYYEEDYWLFNERSGKYFTVKESNADTDDAAVMQVIMDSFQDSLNKVMTYLYDTHPEEVTLEQLGTMMDVDSFAKFYLINEFTCNKESTASSFYWYKDGLDDILHGGPIWDFDSSMGNEKNEAPYYMENHVLFNRLLTCPAFYNRAVEIYQQNKEAFVKMASNAELLKAQIDLSASMNFIRWNVWGESNPKYTLNDYSYSYREGCEKLTKWLVDRVDSFAVRHLDTSFAYVNDDCTVMELSFSSDKAFDSVRFALWSDEAGQNDLRWYSAEKNSDGVWSAHADLSAHQSLGTYTIHVYGTQRGKESRAATAHSYVEKLNESEFSAKLSEDQLFIDATMSGVGMYQDLAVHVWCKTDGDHDLRKYAVSGQEDYTKTCVIELRNHNELGEYCVQFYGMSGDTWTLLEEISVTVSERNWPDLEAEVLAMKKELSVSVDKVKTFNELELLVWGEENGDDDAAVYELSKNADGTWTGVIDLDKHEECGMYRIEVFGITEDGKTKIATESVEVAGMVFPSETIPVYRLYNPNTQEHLLTASEEEKNALLEINWRFDGVAWAASKTGIPVYRLYNPYDDWHTYSMSAEEIASLTELGWTVDGIVFTSTEATNHISVYRLFNPYEKMNYHLLTSSEEEREMLLSLGWLLDGVALRAVSQ